MPFKLGGGPKCVVCGKAVYFNERLRFGDADYHKACFKCTACGKRLELGKQADNNKQPYCQPCYKVKFGPRGYGFGGGAGVLTHTGVPPIGSAAAPPKAPSASASAGAAAAPSKRSSAKRSSVKRSSAKRSSTKRSGAKSGSASGLRKELKGTRWVVENATAADGVITVEVTSKSQTVAIMGAKDATVVVTGKANSIGIMGCTKTKVLFDRVIAMVSVSGCKRMQVQAREFCPTFQVDSTDGCLLYLSEECVANPDFMVTASKSSEMNISFPEPGSEDGDYMELPLPEQFKYNIDVSGDKPQVLARESDLYSG